MAAGCAVARTTRRASRRTTPTFQACGSLRRTGRLCVVHEDTRTMGVGAELAALAAEHALDDLRAPVERLAMPDVAGIPASGPMEDFLIPDRTRIAATLRTLAAIDRGQRTTLVVNGRTVAPTAPSS